MIPEAVELVDGYRSKTLSPVEVTQAALDAIDTYDGRVNAFVLVDRDGAVAAARESEARWQSGEPLGPGDGVPTSIKDALWTRGWPTLRGSQLVDAAGPWRLVLFFVVATPLWSIFVIQDFVLTGIRRAAIVPA